MPQAQQQTTYDARLFSGGLRQLVHESRFLWLQRQTVGMGGSVLELGCFNARSLDFLSFRPTSYVGLDAGWEGGLAEAKNKYPEFDFKQSLDPSDIKGRWDTAIALETLEHLPRPEVLEQYIQALSASARTLIVTVPMEIGLLFAAKYYYKALVHGYKSRHTFPEVVYQTLGRCDKVEQDNHRGFDYRSLVAIISKYYNVDRVEGLNTKLPKWLNTQIGIIARSKTIA